jgi:glycerol-3-phosphate O-acyltransferase
MSSTPPEPQQDEEPKPAAGEAAPRPDAGVGSSPRSAMTPRFNFLFRWFANRFFRHFELEEGTVERLRSLEERGAVIYVMRYSSRLDYFLFNALFKREGLRLSSFANGLHFYYYRPIPEFLRILFTRRRPRSLEVEHEQDRQRIRQLAGERRSFFLFLRTARFRSFLSGRRRQPRHSELDLLEEAVAAVWDDEEKPVYVVPLALFWRKGPRSESRFLNLSYGALTRPSDLAKVSSFLATYRSLSVKTGSPIDLQAFIREHRSEGASQVARKVRRSILIYLYREEKVVEGPTLRAQHRVQREVLADAGVRRAIEERSEQRRSSPERARAQAEKSFREIAANMNSTFLAVLAAVVGWMLRRLFASIDVVGLPKVAEYAKRHPVVLVPSHRSYFDFVILSWLFYGNYLVPPHIAARENMAFGPFGFIFRRAGAFFLRRSFADPLYKEVFRAYVAYLVREGFTQEFFIEGGRSRTGKTMAPRLGMLGWDVEAFIASHRRDLFFIPIAITYERLVEESSMVDELQGGKKQEESVLGLVRARRYLQSRFGSAYVSFGEPISLADALGERRERFRELAASAPTLEEGLRAQLEAERKATVEELGQRIVERINWAMVANATSVAACVLLGAPHRGLRREEMVERMQQVLELLRLQDVRITLSLQADEAGGFQDSIAFMLRSDLIQSLSGPRGEILFFEESRRRALDMYRNSIAHYLAAASFMARRLGRGATAGELREDLAAWQDALYQEFYAPRAEVLAAHGDAYLDYFERSGWVQRRGELLAPTAAGAKIFAILEGQTRGAIEAYQAACDAAAVLEEAVTRKEFCTLAAQQFGHAELLGEAGRREASNDTTFTNALDLLVRRGILSQERRPKKGRGQGRGKKKPVAMETVFSPCEDGAALAELRTLLLGGTANTRDTLR